MKKKSRTIKVLVGAVTSAAVVIGAVVWVRAQSANITVNAQAPQTVILATSDIKQSVSLSGVIESGQTTNIYSTQSYPVKEIYVETGDTVKAGDILAVLDMAKLENDKAQAEINYNNAILSTNEDQRQLANSITNATTSLEASQISLARQQHNTANAENDLREAEAKLNEPFDSYNYDRAIEDAKITLARKTDDLLTAQADMDESINDFDDYTYQNAIHEAEITLNRKKADLEEAEKNLSNEQKSKPDKFDDYTYQNAIRDAEKNLDRKSSDFQTAQGNYYLADDAYFAALNNLNSTGEYIEQARISKENAQTAMENAKRLVNDAQESLDRANADLSKAKNNYNKSTKDTKEDKVSVAQKTYDSALNAVDDAQRVYDKAVTDLDRAKDNASSNASDKLTAAKNAAADAERAYEKALTDKERAIHDYIEANEKNVETAQKSLTDSQKQLQTTQNNVKSAQNTLLQANEKPVTSLSNIELQALNLEKLQTQLSEGRIIATADGVVTEANAKVGATPSGILFVIEDMNQLYVSAKIKEYNLSAVTPGQKAIITTDATGDTVYEGNVTYISPKAVSESSSTSVEFELRAALSQPDPAVKIGMNAFINIITAEKEDVYAVPLSIIVSNERGNFVYTTTENGATEVPVSIGLRTSTSAEITGDGLYEGLELLADPEGKIGQSDTRTGLLFGGGGN